jgi:hypothetical protein
MEGAEVRKMEKPRDGHRTEGDSSKKLFWMKKVATVLKENQLLQIRHLT